MTPPVLVPWPDLRGVVHGFLGRLGGVSRGPFASLNLSYLVGDDRGAVDENWNRARRIIGESCAVATVRQVHGNDVRLVTRECAGAPPEGDGMVTAERGIILGILTADCVPILMIDAEARVACALHAGWRGTIAGIAGIGVRSMLEAGADPARIRAALGPSIGWCCFEVDAELADSFELEVEGAGEHVRPGRPGKAYLDLRGIVAHQLRERGVRSEAIIHMGPCTRCAHGSYFSRRSVGGAVSGLQLSVIGFES